MPMLIQSPEQWFRTLARDFYEFRPAKGQTGLPLELTDWIKEKLPHRALTLLGPSEHSGWICGGPTMYVLAMDPQEVDAYTARWEETSGRCIDERWQCFQWPYSGWLLKFERIDVSKGRPMTGTQYRWLLCAAGLYWLRGSYTEESEAIKDFPGIPCRDDWWWACQSFPEVQTDRKQLLMGSDWVNDAGERVVTFDAYRQEDDDLKFDLIWDRVDREQAGQRVRSALHLTDEVKIHYGFD